LEALHRYISDDDQLSELSELSESDSDKDDPSSQPAYKTSRQTQDDGTTMEGNQNLLTRAAKRKARAKEASKRNKKKKKINGRSENQLNNPVQNAQPAASSYSAENFNISARGYIGKRDKGHERTYWLHEMVGQDSIFKFGLKEWDGRLVSTKYSVK
jgi:hypothetical protein